MPHIDWPTMRSADGGEFAAWILSLVDEGPDRLAIIEVPRTVPEHELDELEAAFLRAYDRAKRDRPDLSVSLNAGPDPQHPNAQLLIAVHEHEWVGSECIRGCGQTR